MRMAITAVFFLQAWLYAVDTDSQAHGTELRVESKYALRELPYDSYSKFSLKPIAPTGKTYEPAPLETMNEFDRADQAAICEAARFASSDGKNPVQADYEFALKQRFGADVDLHDKMMALRVGPYAEPAHKVIIGRKGAAEEWARNHVWSTPQKKITTAARSGSASGKRIWNSGGVKEGFLPAGGKYESTAAWNARQGRERAR